MPFPTSAEIKAKWGGLVRAHWPGVIVILFTFLGWICLQEDGNYFVPLIGLVGVVYFLPLFKLEKSVWIYVAAFGLCGVNDIGPEGARQVADLMGFESLDTWSASMVVFAIQGAVASFLFVVLLYLFFPNFRGSAALLFRVPICVLFLLAALTPAFLLLWLIAGLTGMLGPI